MQSSLLPNNSVLAGSWASMPQHSGLAIKELCEVTLEVLIRDILVGQSATSTENRSQHSAVAPRTEASLLSCLLLCSASWTNQEYLLDLSDGIPPFLLLGGHGSRFELKFMQYINNKEKNGTYA